ncbi:MAG TPA: YidB family protein [Nitrospira sp.]|nr:YidB family protein [Nitrospira sp.]
MGLMDQLGQAVGGMMGGQGGQNPLLQVLTSLLGKDGNIGGLAGLVQAFQKNGLGDIVNSWVGTGQNLPVTPSQIEQGLGGDLLSQLASKAGLSSGAASSQLAGLLPDLIDKLTPNGKIEAGGFEQLLKFVQGR